jgi:hypothetical protein
MNNQTVTIDLDTPIKRGETEINQLVLRRPQAGSCAINTASPHPACARTSATSNFTSGPTGATATRPKSPLMMSIVGWIMS